MWIDQRFIALDADDVVEFGCLFCDFRHPFGPAAMSGRSQGNFRAPRESELRDSHIVGGDDHRVQIFRFSTSFQVFFFKQKTAYEMQRFSRKTRGSPPSGNNAEYLI